MTDFLPLKFGKFENVLIANRGEIALRIVRACRDMQISPLGIYSDADKNSKHLSLCDKIYNIGAGPSSESYLNIEKIIHAAKKLNAQAVHPGFGFLSENPFFANEVIKNGMIWIGPSPQSISQMGNKTIAKKKALEMNIPCCPGVTEPLKNVEELEKVAQKIGFPLILKAASGGGGRGMRVVYENSELKSALEVCSREAMNYFGNPDVYCERYIENPRHIEFQIFGDSVGNAVHLFERDCTIQRRHQKLVEESPSQYISEEIRKEMGDIAVKIAKSVNYVNAGTVEFILESPTKFYFMEMNTRIQVEHPVTEIVTGIDLLQLQFQIAQGHKLPFQQEDLKIRGHCMECRINSEDPFEKFRPDIGTISHVEFPQGPGVRVDSHIYSNYKIPEFYDSMIAKLIVFGQNRKEALAKMLRALNEFKIQGVHTTIPFHLALFENEDFKNGNYSVRFLEENEMICEKYHYESNDISEEQSCLLSILHHCEKSNPSEIYSFKEVSKAPWGQAFFLESTRR